MAEYLAMFRRSAYRTPTEERTTMRLSKQIIESETAPNDGRGQKFVKDDGCEGLWLRVSAGGKKSFVFEGRVKGTKYRRPVGVWPEISLIEARQRVHDIRREINRGVDPFKAADEAAAAVHAEATFSGLAEEYFKSHAIPGQKAESSITADRRNLANHIPKEWYARRLSTFAREDFENLRHGIRGGDATKEVRGRVRQTGGPIIANRVIALLKTMMNLAIKRGMLRGGNPVAGMDKFKERRRMIAYTSDELSR